MPSQRRIIDYFFKIAALGLLALAATYLLRHAWQLDGWHHNDELAHVDYVFRLAHEQRWPRSQDKVSRELVEFSAHRFGYPRPDDLSLPDYGIGLQAFSYEAHQPPLYYLMLALPEALFHRLGCALDFRLRALRLFTVVLMLAGWGLFFHALRPLVFRGFIPSSQAWLATGLLAFFSAADHYHISNDQAGLLWGSLLTRQCLLMGFRPSATRGAWALATALLATATKASNALWLLPILGLGLSAVYTGLVSFRDWLHWRRLIALWPLLLWLPALMSPDAKGPLSETSRLFSIISPGLFDSSFFLQAFMSKAMDFAPLGLRSGPGWPLLLLALQALAALLWTYLTPPLLRFNPGLWWLMVLWPLVILAAGYLNQHVGSVFWFEFRIFSSYYPLLILFLLLPWPLWRRLMVPGGQKPCLPPS